LKPESQYASLTYYFCSKECKEQFEVRPEQLWARRMIRKGMHRRETWDLHKWVRANRVLNLDTMLSAFV
jgi:hypothetical protein